MPPPLMLLFKFLIHSLFLLRSLGWAGLEFTPKPRLALNLCFFLKGEITKPK